ncbi:hypothetical protein [uncultured Nostoc sp.]|uniref:hypothetical protein n=1 Tax=uncultured Nostoc sp. TaxID=340711 RepID=UPI0035CA0E08
MPAAKGGQDAIGVKLKHQPICQVTLDSRVSDWSKIFSRQKCLKESLDKGYEECVGIARRRHRITPN